VKAIAEVWPALDHGKVRDRELLVDVLKRLLRLSAVVEFEALDDDEIRRQVTAVTAESIAALRPEP
jgi:hypothetical protein